jgi:hypothetical protein
MSVGLSLVYRLKGSTVYFEYVQTVFGLEVALLLFPAFDFCAVAGDCCTPSRLNYFLFKLDAFPAVHASILGCSQGFASTAPFWMPNSRKVDDSFRFNLATI